MHRINTATLHRKVEMMEKKLQRSELTQKKIKLPLSYSQIEDLVKQCRKNDGEPTVIQQFTEQARKYPNHIAVSFENKAITYRQLDEKSNQFSSYLKEQGVEAHDLLIIYMEKDIDIIIVLLAILKTRCAYIPIDPDTPIERIKIILNEIKPSKLITSVEFFNQSQLDPNNIIYFKVLKKKLQRYSNKGFNLEVKSNDLMYIIYTSGTTGKPKGVMIEHGHVGALFQSALKLFEFKHTDHWAFFHSTAFDFSVWEIWGALITGATLVVVPKQTTQNPLEFYRLLEKKKITILCQTPSVFRQLQIYDKQRDGSLSHLRYVFFGGEALFIKDCREWLKKYGDNSPQFINMYGATETTVHVTYKKITCSDMESEKSSLIGFPLPHLFTLVLNEKGEICQPGEVGELYVGGLSLARGYALDPKLTNDKFVHLNVSIPDGISDGVLRRFYRTGDFVSLRSDKSLEYIGRSDEQVKVRGYRIELGEIEYYLEKHPDVRQSVVIVAYRDKKISDKYLVAYLVLKGHKESIDIEALRQYLLRSIPSYMVPAVFIFLDKFPISSNGKINKGELPDPSIKLKQSSSNKIKPRNKTEEILARIWKKVLSLDEVGIFENFFLLGGDSLSASRVINRVNHKLKSDLTIADIFKRSTIYSLALYIDEGKSSLKDKTLPITLSNISSCNKNFLSIQQQQLYFLHRYKKQSDRAYTIHYAWRISGALDKNALEKSFQEILNRHPILTDKILVENELPIQLANSDHELNLKVDKINNKDLSETLKKEADNTLKLIGSRLFRVKLFKLNDNEHVLFLCFHHAIFDAWSMDIFLDDLGKFYGAFLKKNLPPKIKDTSNYFDYCRWQSSFLQHDKFNEGLKFWEQYLKGYTALSLPLNNLIESDQTFEGKRHYFNIQTELANKITKLSQSSGITPFIVLLTVFNILLARHSNQNDIIIGVPMANRTMLDFENTIGFFVNTLPFRTNLKNPSTFSEILKDVKDNYFGVFKYQDIPLESIVSALQIDRSFNQNPIFQVAFVLQNRKTIPDPHFLENLEVKELRLEPNTSQFDLMLEIIPHENHYECAFEYNTSLANPELIRRMSDHFLNLLNYFIKSPSSDILTAPMLTSEEIKRLYFKNNETRHAYPDKSCLIDLFQEQVIKTPNSIAVTCGDENLTYNDLNNITNQLARHLLTNYVIKKKNGNDFTIIMLYTERSFELIIGILAALKLGAAYLPIDTTFPKERVKHIVSDANPTLILTQKKFLDSFIYNIEDVSSEMIVAVDQTYASLEDYSSKNLDIYIEPNSVAYTMYTSGSTGAPKGVIIEHTSIINRIHWMQLQFGLLPTDVVLQKTPYNFDVSVWELFWPLFVGARLVFAAPELHRDPDYLIELIHKHSITVTHFVPSMLNAFLDIMEKNVAINREKLKSLKYIFTSGETLSVNLKNRLLKSIPVKLYNLYGPTEVTIDVSSFKCDEKHTLPSNTVPIGKPIYNTQFFVYDKFGNLCPIGVIGELYIGGVGLARGYLNNPVETKEKFIVKVVDLGNDRCSRKFRLYKSGDLVRWLPNMSLEFVRRSDQQVKLRGFRIELEGIRKHIESHPDVNQSTVILKKDKNKRPYLSAYLTVKKRLNLDDLQRHLSNSIPYYMIPSSFTILESIPMTPNGKIDLNQLIKYKDDKITTLEHDDVKLSFSMTPTQSDLQKIWAKVLNFPIKKVPINKSFFSLGGDSIIALQIMSEAKNYGYHITIRDIFQNPKIEDLARNISKNRSFPIADRKVKNRHEVGMSPIQCSFFKNDFQNRNHYIQVTLTEWNETINVKLIRMAIVHLMNKHDVFSAKFIKDRDRWVQFFDPNGKNENLQILEIKLPCGKSMIETMCCVHYKDLARHINIHDGHLMSAAILTTEDCKGKHLLIAIHHLVVDAVSWWILFQDLQTFYNDLQESKPFTQLIRTTPYDQWSQELYYSAKNDLFSSQIKFWLKQTSAVKIPKDFPESANIEIDRMCYAVSVDEVTTKKLIRYSTSFNDNSYSLLSILLMCFGRTYQAWSSHSSLLIDLEYHGRSPAPENCDLSRTVGWFTAIYPLLLDLTQINMSSSLSIQFISNQLSAVPSKGIGFGILYYLSQNEELLTTLKRPEISFNYLGFLGKNLEEDSLFKLKSLELYTDKHSERPYLIDIVVAINNFKLTVSCNYNVKHFKSETIIKLVDDFKNTLIKLTQENDNIDCLDYIDNPFLDRKKQVSKLNTKIMPLTEMQKGLLFHWLENRDSESYLVQHCWRFDANIDSVKFKKCWAYLTNLYEVFRTTFHWLENDEPFQRIHEKVNFCWEDVTLNQDRELQSFLKGLSNKSFDLNKLPLNQFYWIKVADDKLCFVWRYPHILLDGWSFSILFKKLVDLYLHEEFLYQNKKLITMNRQVHDEHLIRLKLVKAKCFWKKYLKGFFAPNEFQIYKTLQSQKLNRHAKESIKINVNDSRRIRDFSSQHNITLNIVIQAAWSILISHYCQTNDILFGVTMSNRSNGDFNDQVGLYINTLPFRIKLRETTSCLEVMRNVRNTLLDIVNYRDVSLSDIQSWSELPEHSPLFDNLFVFENYPEDFESLKSKIHIEEMVAQDYTHYSLALTILPKDSITLNLNYSISKLSKTQSKYMLNHLLCLIIEMCDQPQMPIKNLARITDKELYNIILWNKTDLEYNQNETLVDLFEKIAKKLPEKLALICEDTQLTYKDLNRRADCIASNLRNFFSKIGIKSSQRYVGIYLDRNISFIVAILGILKSGAAFIPLNMELPEERLKYMVSDSNLQAILTSEKLVDNLVFASNVELIDINKLSFDKVLTINVQDPYRASLDNLAYVIYTSGSTGQPKGVCCHHRGVINLLNCMQKTHPLTSNDIATVWTDFSFDVSIYEIFSALNVGASLHILSDKNRFYAESFISYLIKNNITSAFIPKFMLYKFYESLKKCYSLKKMARLIVGVEPIEQRLLSSMALLMENENIINIYGPTETAIFASLYFVRSNDKVTGVTPIGQPVNNLKFYVLDNKKKLLPIGCIGELYISGDGVSQGYLNQPDLTSASFIENPFYDSKKDNNTHARLYKTGDLVSWNENGQLLFVGRNDFQTKIRGYRVELNEIVIRMQSYPEVLQAAAISKCDRYNDAYIIGFYTSKSKISDNKFLSYLSRYLPDYMMPSRLIRLDEMPMTNNAKLDRKKLLEYDNDLQFKEEEGVPYALKPHEEKLCQMLAYIFALDLSKVNLDASLYSLGMHSISALRILSEVKKVFNLDLGITDIIKSRNVLQLANKIKSLLNKENLPTAGGRCSIPDPIVILESDGDQPPLFLIHPAGGTLFYYLPLIRALNGQRQIYGLQDPGVTSNQILFDTIEEMAKFYISSIKKYQTKGPYLLAGSSFGASVAVEIAYQLKCSGEEIAFVGLFDGWAKWPNRVFNDKQEFEAALCKQYELLSSNFSNVNQYAKPLIEVNWSRMQMLSQYSPPTDVDFDITLFKADILLDIYQNTSDDMNHWKVDGPNKIHVLSIPGDHFTIHIEPNVSVLAEKLSRCLTNIGQLEHV